MSDSLGTRLDSLFYELELRAQGFQDGLKTAQASADKFTTFMEAHPVAVAGVFAAALVGVAVKATEMAGAVDAAARRIGASVPEAIGRLNELKEAAREQSLEFGRSQVEILNGMQLIGEKGVDSFEDLIDSSHAAALASEATGHAFDAMADSLDSAKDVFKGLGIEALSNEAILAKLLVTAQGKGTIEDLAQGFGRLALKLQAAKVDFETASAATATLIGRGANARTAIAELGEVLEKQGAGGLKELAAQSKVASDGLAEMRAQAQQNGETLEASSRKLKENFNAALIDLGQTILPLVTKELQGLVGLLDLFNGSVSRIEQGSALATLTSLSNVLGKLEGSKAAEAVQRLEAAVATAVPGATNFDDALNSIASHTVAIGKLGPEGLAAVAKGVDALAKSGELSNRQLGLATQALKNLNAEMERPGRKPVVVVAPKAVESTTAATEGVKLLTAAQVAAVKSSSDLTAEQKQTILTAKALSETMDGQVAKAMKEAGDRAKQLGEKYAAAMKKVQDTLAASTVTLEDDTKLAMSRLQEELKAAGVSADDTEKALRPLNDQLRLIGVNEKFKLPEILEKSAKALGELEVARLKDAEREIGAIYATTVKGTKEHEEVAKRLVEVQTKIRDATRDTLAPLDNSVENWRQIKSDAHDIGEAVLPKFPFQTEEHNKKLQTTIEKIGAVAQGAIGIADAFGLTDSKAAAVLQNVVAIGLNIGKAFGGDPTAVVGVLGSLAGVIGGLFGDSAENRARKELLRKNNEVIAELVRVNGDILRATAPGATISAAKSALTQFLGESGTPKGDIGPHLNTKLTQALLGQGLGFDDLEDLGKKLGITLRNPENGQIVGKALQQLLDALNASEFTQFGDSFSDQMERIRTFLQAGVLDPTEEFAAVLEVLAKKKSGSPAILSALEGIDVTTDEGRKAATAALRGLLGRTNPGAGVTPLSDADLGGLSGKEFISVIQQLIGVLTSDTVIKAPIVAPLGPSVTPGQPPVEVDPLADPSFSPTDEAASWDQALDQGTQQIDLLAQIVANTRAPAFQPPPLSAVFGTPATQSGPGAGKSTTVNLSLTINASQGTDVEAVAAAAKAGALQGLNEALGLELLLDQLPLGSNTRSTN